MKVANINENACMVLNENRAWRIAEESQGRFGPHMPDIFLQWPEFIDWAGTHQPGEIFCFTEDELGPVSPAPGQIFAVGLNYDEHAQETGLAVNVEFPPVFPKWASSLAKPRGTLAVPDSDSHIDWEVELVAIIGREGKNIPRHEAMHYLAGFTVGQDFSDRQVQFAGETPQWGLAKSFAGFSPIGPWLVTPDELTNGKAQISCAVNGIIKQCGTLDQMIFSVPDIIAIISGIVTLKPGDIIFTGTPSGVGFAREPAEYLQPGQVVVSTIEGIGALRQLVVAR
ncbi:fumarylacetoacetate hydrolase family protein [Enterobacter hormaechei]|nr:fumarylacetoacetate hydrolase family protein [Enterobacter hormaechei]